MNPGDWKGLKVEQNLMQSWEKSNNLEFSLRANSAKGQEEAKGDGSSDKQTESIPSPTQWMSGGLRPVRFPVWTRRQ